jgi:hypothetical protein
MSWGYKKLLEDNANSTTEMKMSQQDIADVVGTDRITVNRKMKRLTLGDEYLFAEVNVGKKNYYMLNPFVFYRKQGKPDATLQTIFAVKRYGTSSV